MVRCSATWWVWGVLVSSNDLNYLRLEHELKDLSVKVKFLGVCHSYYNRKPKSIEVSMIQL